MANWKRRGPSSQRSFAWRPKSPEGREKPWAAVLLELSKAAEAIPPNSGSGCSPEAPSDADQGIETNLAYAFAQSGQPAKAMPHFEAGTLHLAAARDGQLGSGRSLL